MQLEGRRVLLTGASRGIGAELAKGFRRAGAQVALVARPSEALREAAAQADGTAYPADLSETGDIADLVARVEADGPVDVLVNNAGVANVGWYFDRTPAEIEQVLTVNLVAPMLLTRLLVPGMLERGRGHVVNVSSMAAVIAPPGLVHYGASKSGLSHFGAGLRADLRDDPIDVTTVHFASVKTDMDAEARSYGPLRMLAEQSKGRDVTPMPVFVDAVVDAVRTGRPEVRFPRPMGVLPALANAPRRVGRLLFRQAPARTARGEG